MRKGTVERSHWSCNTHRHGREPAVVRTVVDGTAAPADILERVRAAASVDSDVIVATTGYTGRELYSIDDRPNHLYMVGSMGCASSLGLGLALARPDLRVVVIDGDGAALMRMGASRLWGLARRT